MNFFEKTHYICTQIPTGKVASYGQIARLAGNSKMARQVGWAMNKSPETGEVPAHRVVNREGVLSGAGAFDMEGQQEMMLRSEGVEVRQGKVDMKQYCWKPSEEELNRLMQKMNREMDFFEFMREVESENAVIANGQRKEKK